MTPTHTQLALTHGPLGCAEPPRRGVMRRSAGQLTKASKRKGNDTRTPMSTPKQYRKIWGLKTKTCPLRSAGRVRTLQRSPYACRLIVLSTAVARTAHGFECLAACNRLENKFSPAPSSRKSTSDRWSRRGMYQ